MWAVVVGKTHFGPTDATAQEVTIVWNPRVPLVILYHDRRRHAGARRRRAAAPRPKPARRLVRPRCLFGASLGTARRGWAVGIRRPSAGVLVAVYAFAQHSGSFTDTRPVLAGVALG